MRRHIVISPAKRERRATTEIRNNEMCTLQCIEFQNLFHKYPVLRLDVSAAWSSFGTTTHDSDFNAIFGNWKYYVGLDSRLDSRLENTIMNY